MLHARTIPVTMLVRDEHYWGRNLPPEEASLIKKKLEQNGIEIRLKTALRAFESDANGNVCATFTENNERIPCSFAGIATGVIPNIELARKCGLQTNRGILVDEFLQTNQPDVYAAGDCAELKSAHNKIEQLWYTGRLQGETVAHNICGRKIAYNRGIPFNSAKFFDLELQTYGSVVPQITQNESSFFWQNPEGLVSLRLNYVNRESCQITGITALGMRLKQAVCETWIAEKRTLPFVIMHLKEANFDGEFCRRFEKDILQAFKMQHPEIAFPQTRRKFSWF